MDDIILMCDSIMDHILIVNFTQFSKSKLSDILQETCSTRVMQARYILDFGDVAHGKGNLDIFMCWFELSTHMKIG